MAHFLELANDYLYGYALVFLLILAGIYLSIVSGFIQLQAPFRSLGLFKAKSTLALSPLESFALTTAARVGIGNIIGLSMAVSIGGAGAIFWMWVVAFLGGASAFCESTLAQIYKVKDSSGFKGGPAYYIRYGLGLKPLSLVFACFLICADIVGFNGVLGHSISSVVRELLPSSVRELSSTTLVVGLFVSAFAALMFLRFGVRASLWFVPIMSALYFALAFWVFFSHIDRLANVASMVFSSAFDMRSIFGGFASSAIVVGAKRGLFSNEAGMGSAPNAAASASVAHPCEQGFVQSFSVLCDLLVCTATGVLVLFSNAFLLRQKDFVIYDAMSEYFGAFGLYFISFFILLFGLSSFFGNYYYSLANLKLITTRPLFLRAFELIAIACVFVGTQLELKLVWGMADFLMALMSIVNIICVLLLSGVVLRALASYKKGEKFNPKALNIHGTTCW